MLSLGEIRRKPGKQQIENIVVGAVAEGEADDFALLQEIGERGAGCRADRIFRLRAAVADVVAFDLGEFGVRAGVAEESEEKREIDDAGGSGESEVGAPAKMNEHKAKERNADRRRKFGHGVKGCGGQA